MSQLFADRLRETIVYEEPGLIERFQTAISDIANVDMDYRSLLSLVELAFFRSASNENVDDWLIGRLSTQAIEVPARSHQLVATVASLALIERLSSSANLSAKKRLLANAVAAYGVIVLDNQQLECAHSDLPRTARFWRDETAERLRTRAAKAKFSPESAMAGETTEQRLAEIVSYLETLQNWLNRLAAPTVLDSTAEELDILWWLQSAKSEGTVEQAVIDSSDELLDLVKFYPGPPGEGRILKRRLGALAKSEVDLEALIALQTRRELRPSLRRFCVLLSGSLEAHNAPMSALDAARSRFDELELVQLVEESPS